MVIRISLLSYIINTTVCTVVLGFLWNQTRRHTQGVGWWVAGFGLSLLAVALLVLRGIFPDLLSILVANLALVLSNFLLFIGLERFLDRISKQTHNIILFVVFAAIHSYFTYGQDNLSIRTINFSVALIVLNLQIAWLLLYRTDHDMRLAIRGLAIIFSLAIVVSLVRIVAELTMPSDNNLLNASSLQQIMILLAYQVLVVLLAFGLVLMVTQRLLITLRSDIIQRQQVEADLRDSDARLTASLSAIPDLMFRLSREGIHLDFYAPDPKKLFVAADEFIGRSVEEVLPPEVGKTYLEHITACLTNDEAQTFQYTLTFDPEDKRYYEARMVPLNAEEVLTIVRDITDLKQVEAELRDSDARLKAILSAIPDLMFRISGDGVYLDFFATNLDELLAPPEAFLGKKVVDVLPPDIGQLVMDYVTACLETREPQAFEYALDIGNDEPHQYEARMVPLKTDEVLTIVRDITDRKQAESELARHREHLEVLVSQRTQELQTANKELIRLSRAKDEFVSNVSHELRTPLTNLVLRQQLIKSNPKKLDTYLNVMERETKRLGYIIEALLDLSRLDQERIQLDLKEMKLNELVSYYVADREALASSREQSLSFTSQVTQSEVLADENLLGQVLSILLTNAMNYTPAGGRIELSTLREPDRIGFRIVDSGPGISSEDLPKLFDRFFRGRAALELSVAGTGLGLALAQQIVEQHGGTIEVVSQAEPGEGARFTVWLPALKTTS